MEVDDWLRQTPRGTSPEKKRRKEFHFMYKKKMETQKRRTESDATALALSSEDSDWSGCVLTDGIFKNPKSRFWIEKQRLSSPVIKVRQNVCTAQMGEVTFGFTS